MNEEMEPKKIQVEQKKKADDSISKMKILVEEQKIIELEKKLNARQVLELEINGLTEKLEVLKHLGIDDDNEVQRRMKETSEELHQKIEEMNHLEDLNQALVIAQQQSNNELLAVRSVLIQGHSDILHNTRNGIGVKKMGEIDAKAFIAECKKRFPADEALLRASEGCSHGRRI